MSTLRTLEHLNGGYDDVGLPRPGAGRRPRTAHHPIAAEVTIKAVTRELLLLKTHGGESIWIPKHLVSSATGAPIAAGYVGRVVIQGAKTAALTGLLREMFGAPTAP